MVVLMHSFPDIKAQVDRRLSPGMAAPADCALFSLPHVVINGLKIVTDERAPVSIRLRAKLLSDYTGKYSIYIGNGVTGIMTIGLAGSHKTEWKKYSDDQPVNCTPADNIPETYYDSDYTELIIRPDINWLEPGKGFHIFKIKIGGYQCNTHRENYLPPHSATGILIGIKRPQ
jgi:hypothetical protein